MQKFPEFLFLLINKLVDAMPSHKNHGCADSLSLVETAMPAANRVQNCRRHAPRYNFSGRDRARPSTKRRFLRSCFPDSFFSPDLHAFSNKQGGNYSNRETANHVRKIMGRNHHAR
jgi:hypothetical protein